MSDKDGITLKVRGVSRRDARWSSQLGYLEDIHQLGAALLLIDSPNEPCARFNDYKVRNIFE
jgi:hypothetical protein